MKNFKIIELMELFDEGEVIPASEMQRPQKALDREMFQDANERLMKADGGMLVQPGFGGTRQGYKEDLPEGITKTPAGNYKVELRRGDGINKTEKNLSKAKKILKKFKEDNPVKKRTTETTKISGDRLKVLNKYAQDTYGLNYKDLGPGQVQQVYNTARNRGFEYRPSGQSPFPTEQKNKLIEFAKEKNIKLDFDKYPKYGVPKDIKGKRNTNYTKLVNFKNRGFKDFKKNLLSEADRIKVMDNFELPKGVKNWNFDTNRFGLTYEGNENLIQRIKNSLKEKKKYKVAADYSTPKGWMVASMNRVYENEIKNKVKLKDLTYQPIKNSKGIIVGFKDNTEAGGGKKYYSIKKYQDEFGDGTAWAAHGDHERVKKFLNIAKGAQVGDPNKLLQKILDDKGITKLLGENRPLRLNDILTHERYFDKLSTTAPKKLIERQIVLHHTKGVNTGFGNAAATKDLQLLSGVVNQKVKGLEKFAKERKLTSNEIKQLKNYGAKITDFDGKIVGGGFIDPEKQFKLIEKGAIDYAKSDQFNVKTVASYLERLGCGKAAGGRVFYDEGAFGLTKCAKKGRNKLETIIKSGAKLDSNDAKLATQILKAGRSLGSAFTLSGLFGPAAIAFTAATEAGFVGYDMLTSGKTFKEAVGDSLFNYALGEKTKIDPQKELFKRFSGLGYSDEQLSNFANVLNQTNQLNTILKQDLKVGNLKDEVKAFREQPKDTFMSPDDEMSQTDQAIRAEQKLKDESLNLDNLLTAYRKEPNIGTPDFQGTQFSLPSVEDTILGDMASGKFQEAQQELKAANILADLEKEKTAQDNFLKFLRGDISKQARADRIAGLEQDYLDLLQERGPQLTPFAGGGIAGLSGGIDEGPQVESMNPDSQGLQGLMKRARNI